MTTTTLIRYLQHIQEEHGPIGIQIDSTHAGKQPFDLVQLKLLTIPRDKRLTKRPNLKTPTFLRLCLTADYT